MPLSSNSLIHLTKEKDALIGILNFNFKLSFSFEHIRTESGTISAAFPMISFCDIPISEIKNHIEKYGSYGLGMTKEWAIRKGLNPVLYIEKCSTLGAEIRTVFQENTKNHKYSEPDSLKDCLLNILRYTKNYENDLTREVETIKNYRFSDEREWRFVPTRDQFRPLFISQEQYSSKKLEANTSANNILLEFEPNDIKYIIIKEEDEISDFIDVLRHAKRNNYSLDDIERLTTRIITTEQIKTDF